MSASLTIDGSVYPAQSGTLIRFDRGITIQNVPAKRVAKFGDGYAMHVPLGPTVRTYGVAFNNRPTTEIDIIETYFTLLKGESFNIVIRGETIPVVVLSFNKNYQNGEVYGLTASLKEYFN